MKKLSNLKGAKELSKNEQKSINGGHAACIPVCSDGYVCTKRGCVLIPCNPC
jgi:hypothetical protein